MSVVTQIKPQKNQKSFNIYLDGKFAFGLSAEALLKAKIAVGQKLSEKQIDNLSFKNELLSLHGKVLKLISFRPRSEKEIREYLKKKVSNLYEGKLAVKEKLVDKTIGDLKRVKLIDDYVFASWWLEQRAAFRPRGKFGLEAELGQKGISREVVQKVIEEVDEVALAQKAADKKFKTFKKLPPREFHRKMGAFLARRGFSWEVIREVLVID